MPGPLFRSARARPRIVLAPDSFKASLAAPAVAAAMARGLAQGLGQELGKTNAELIQAPMADGGEGTLDCVAAAGGGHWQQTEIEAIHGAHVTACWYRRGDEAVLESATVLGLPLVENCRQAPPLAARGSAALGRLVRAALDAGARSLTVGLGGTACNDAGLGLLLALGARGVDREGRSVEPTIAGLLALARLDLAGLDTRLATTPIRVLCDVDNPLLGARGSCRVYGPQKGLGQDEIAAVEAGFARLAGAVGSEALAGAPGSGAAGGLGFALALLGATLEPGASALIRLTGLDARLAAADLVITGEGRSDTQTLAGKLPLAVARAAGPTPTLLLSGDIQPAARAELQAVFAGCYSLTERAGSVAAALAEPERWLEACAAAIGGSLNRGEPPPGR